MRISLDFCNFVAENMKMDFLDSRPISDPVDGSLISFEWDENVLVARGGFLVLKPLSFQGEKSGKKVY